MKLVLSNVQDTKDILFNPYFQCVPLCKDKQNRKHTTQLVNALLTQLYVCFGNWWIFVVFVGHFLCKGNLQY